MKKPSVYRYTVSTSCKSCPNLFIFLKTGELMNLQTLDLFIKYFTLECLGLDHEQRSVGTITNQFVGFPNDCLVRISITLQSIFGYCFDKGFKSCFRLIFYYLVYFGNFTIIFQIPLQQRGRQ